ncbi:MAG: 50S ribosomal protein L25 [Desulfuromonadaceae bacterium]|nr:50S ribosomal protein L25 [Desulfuromonadaceae bacterium]
MVQKELNVSLRQRIGKGGARSARREGLVPGVVYGSHIEPCAVNVAPKTLEEAINTEAGWNTLLTLKGDGPFDGVLAVVKDIQYDAIRRTPMHIDFQAIDMKNKASFMVPVNAVGKSAGEKEGGSLQVIRKELEVFCLPTSVPASIDINVEALAIGDVVHIDDIAAPEGVELVHDVNFTVITVVGRKPSEEEAAGAEEEA